MSSRGVNKVILLGNLGKDPELRYMPNGGAVANFSIATSEVWKDKETGEPRDKTEWHRCVAFRKLADIIGEYVKKGSKIYVEGKIQTRKWQDQEGNDRYSTEIVVDEMQMLGERSSGGGNSNQGRRPGESGQHYENPPQDNFDDDIPF